MNTQILATIGPKCESKEIIHDMIAAGVDIARMNFSHCTPEEFLVRKKNILAASKKLKKKIAILQDLQGPRIRVGKMPDSGIEIEEGKLYTFAHEKNGNGGEYVQIDDPYLHMDIKPGELFFLANGAMELKVVRVRSGKILAECIKGGMLFSRKGINIPETKYQRGALTQKDIADLKFGIKQGVDYVGLSFVQSADDVLRLRKLLGKSNVKIMSKIERAIAIKNIDEIIRVSDGIIVARGDLGIEIPLEEVPIIQKNIIRHSHWYGKPVIVATQMLMSMVDHQHPTRAEVTDVANAVFERADAVWLSDETANGNYPVQTVKIMKRIIARIDKFLHQQNRLELF